ncbi:MAG TPA: PBP1A family penicillin-binding protein [Candidatus Woesebacteria bacterium]|nr:PBP1A family penicillin-binding protein [Candidatus Woesebacteria bacterium]
MQSLRLLEKKYFKQFKRFKKKNKGNLFVSLVRFYLLGGSPAVRSSLKKTIKTLPHKQRPLTRLLKLPTRIIKQRWFQAVVLLGIATMIGGFWFLLQDLPSPRNLTSQENYPVSTQIFDRNGVKLYEIFAGENRIPIKLESLPKNVINATIAIEDQHFYRHFGFDISGIFRAVITNLRGNRLEGGSTITQQLVKNALLNRDRTLQRKIKEVLLSVMTETLYTKDQILEMYLNYISYGGTAVGIEAASQQYFGKPASQLSLAEAAILAGLPQAPSRYSPFQSDQSAAKNRQSEVLRRMAEDDYISEAEAEIARTDTLNFALSKTDILAPHFVFFVRDQLVEKYGVETVEKGGLRVTTTLDYDLQQTAQASLSAELDQLVKYQVSNGAALVVTPNTGEILAMIGSKDYFDPNADGKVNVTLAERQPGSSIKPIMYATAFQNRVLNPGTLLVDVKTCFTVPGQKDYCPKNYDGSFRGPVTVRQALGNSLNIPAVKALNAIGIETFISQATKMGITSWTDPSRYGLSLTLGGGEIRMIDLAQAFAVLANEGVKVPFSPILKVEDYRGNVLFELDPAARKEALDHLNIFEEETEKNDLQRVMNRAPAYLASHIMQDNTARQWAFGSNSQLVIKNQVVSAKTGTTNNLKDNWTVGFTPEFLVITWVGNNSGKPMNPYLVSGITGAAPIWNDIMSYVLKNREPMWQEKPSDIASAKICATGFPPTAGDGCVPRYTELYWQKSQPSEVKLVKQQVWVDPATGQPPPPGIFEGELKLEEHIYYQDPGSPLQCADCVPVDERSQLELPL